MYKLNQTLILMASASTGFNNLSVKQIGKPKVAESIAVIHKGYINIIPADESELSHSKYVPIAPSRADNITVTQVTWCELGFDSVFAVTSTQGLQVFDAEAYHCIFTHPCKDSSALQGGTFARGITNVLSNYICVGNSGGCLRVFGTLDDTSEVIFIDRKAVHQSAITDISSYDQYIASADCNGDIFYWEFIDEQLISINQIRNFGSCCVGLKLSNDWLVAGYGSGHIRLFDITKVSRDSSQFSLLVEVAAHAKWISGLDISMNLQFILTVSEDSFAKVWTIEKKNDSYIITHLSSTHVTDNLLVGGRFLASNGSQFCVTSYDNSNVYCFKM